MADKNTIYEERYECKSSKAECGWMAVVLTKFEVKDEAAAKALIAELKALTPEEASKYVREEYVGEFLRAIAEFVERAEDEFSGYYEKGMFGWNIWRDRLQGRAMRGDGNNIEEWITPGEAYALRELARGFEIEITLKKSSGEPPRVCYLKNVLGDVVAEVGFVDLQNKRFNLTTQNVSQHFALKDVPDELKLLRGV